jgi:streptogramin lyase
MFTSLASVIGALLIGTSAQAQTPASVALTGTVSSPQEGAMEGVLVTAKKDGATIATTVVTDATGHYAFPASRLEPGHYTLRIRAVGYNLDGPGEATIAAGKSTQTDIKLRKTGNLSAQLTNAEWLISMPGTDEQKRMLGDCLGCHTLRLITGSVYKAEDFRELIPLMGRYYPGTMPGKKQILPTGPRGNRGVTNMAVIEPAAKYFETINLSNPTGKYTYDLQTLPRPTGRATKVIITTYDLPRPTAMPHDAIVVKGKAYYSDFGALYIGELDPATGKVTDYKLPMMKAPPAPQGTLGLHPDRDGNLWVAMMYQGGLVRFNTTTKEITPFPLPPEWQNGSTQESMVSPRNWHVDGKVWTNDQSDHTFLRLDVATGKYEKFPVLRDQNGDTINGYELPSDQNNNLWALEFGGAGQKIGMVDAKTGKLTTWKSPFARARPRRGQFDKDGVLWFAEFGANAVASFDPETQTIKEWVLPTPWSQPYDAVKSEKTGEVWTGSMSTDRVTRFNPASGEFVDYLLPEYTNIRRVWFDDASNAFWTGANHRPALVKVEPLD